MLSARAERLISLISTIERKIRYIKSEIRTDDAFSKTLIDQEQELCDKMFSEMSTLIGNIEAEIQTSTKMREQLVDFLSELKDELKGFKDEYERDVKQDS